MKKLLPDPDLERLVQELDRSDSGDPEPPPPAGATQGDAPPPALDPVALGEVGEGEALDRLLARMVRQQASDLLLVPGSPPASLAELVTPARGLVLVCGPTGAGKSSTLAALVDRIRSTRPEELESLLR
ncbi:MAG TPA: ATPase, T2SS/T4P/T4SS family [Thermoanaerobaculia bacterium]|nr:ATPase, T2SS/T4P/T4SS family [Thermoanaerobaculia bacterium]